MMEQRGGLLADYCTKQVQGGRQHVGAVAGKNISDLSDPEFGKQFFLDAAEY